MSPAQDKKPLIPRKWDATQIPSQHGRVAIVTGANSGIGYVTARELARYGAHVVLACRTASKGHAAVQSIQQEISATHRGDVGQVEFMQLDVGSLASVKAFTDDFKAKFNRIDLLINNAGIMGVPYTLTADGYESIFATNHLGHFALTAQLFELLKAGDAPRIVSLSSNLHTSAKVDPEVIVITKAKYKPLTAYGNSKLCNLLFAYELQRRLTAAGHTGVLSVAAHPGTTQTNILAETSKNVNSFSRFFLRVAQSLFCQEVEMGALPTLYAATAPDVRPGEYFGPQGLFSIKGYPRRVESNKKSHSEPLAAKLWSLSETMATRFNVE